MNGPARKRFWSIAPDSPVAQDMRAGRPPWLPFVHLVWTAWVFLTPMFAGGGYGYTKDYPVERFMREHFTHTEAVSRIVSRFVEGAQPRRLWQTLWHPLLSHRFEGDFCLPLLFL